MATERFSPLRNDYLPKHGVLGLLNKFIKGSQDYFSFLNYLYLDSRVWDESRKFHEAITNIREQLLSYDRLNLKQFESKI